MNKAKDNNIGTAKTEIAGRRLVWRLMAMLLVNGSLMVPVTACTTAYLFLRWNPVPWYWTEVFEPLALYNHWPWLMASIVLSFALIGIVAHELHGGPLWAPLPALLFAGVCVISCTHLGNDWAMDWAPVWCCLVAASMLLAWAVGIFALWAYTEAWRYVFNGKVVDYVTSQLQSGAFLRELKARRKGQWLRRIIHRGRGEVKVKGWGSRHCLIIIQGYYDDKRLALLSTIGKPNVHSRLSEYETAAETLSYYLRMKWNRIELSDLTRRSMLEKLLRELIVVAVWFDRRVEPLRVPMNSTTVRNWIEEWCDLCEIRKFPAYRQILLAAFHPSTRASPGSREEAECICTAVNNFAAVCSEGDDSENTSRRDIAARTWFALSSALPPKARLDIWHHMRRSIPGVELAINLIDKDMENVDVSAVFALAEGEQLYLRWASYEPKDWRGLLNGSGQHLADVLEGFSECRKDVWPTVRDRTRRQSSWLHTWALRTPAVRWSIAATFLGIVAPGLIGIYATNPRLPSPRTDGIWNSIEYVVPRGGPLMGSWSDVTSMAGETGDRYLAIGGAEGVCLLDKASRVPRAHLTTRPVLDVAVGPSPDEFLALDTLQGIDCLEGTRVMSPPWLSAPNDPLCPIGSMGNVPQILANAVDEKGWLVAIKGWGIARYEFGRLKTENALYRLRNWRTSVLHDQPIERAIITKHSVWACTSNVIHCIDRDSLLDVAPRLLVPKGLAKLKWFDVDPDDQWAAAVYEGVGTFLWSPGPAGGSWVGPFMADVPRDEAKVRSIKDIIAARVANSVVFLATADHVFARDLGTRTMHSIGSISNLRWMEPLGAGDNLTGGTVLVAGPGGQVKISGPDTDGNYATSTIDSDPVTAFSVSADHGLCLYRVRPANGTAEAGDEIRDMPLAIGSRASVLIPAGGWKQLPSSTAITGIAHLDQQIIFGTNKYGAFLYDPIHRTYKDCSNALFAHLENGKRTENIEGVRVFQHLAADEASIVAIADQKPLVLEDATNSTASWRALDPLQQTSPQQVAVCDGRFFGLGNNGEIFHYLLDDFPTSFCKGSSAELAQSPPQTSRFTGDLAVNGSWKAAFIHRQSLCVYDGITGAMKELQIPSQKITQIRFAGDDLVSMLEDGRLFKADPFRADGDPLYGGSIAPFDVRQTTAISNGDLGSVIVAGPSGAVVKYQWRHGLWKPVVKTPIPSGTRDVLELNNTSMGVVATIAGGQVFFGSPLNDAWAEIPDCIRCAIDTNRDKVWALNKIAGIRMLEPSFGENPSKWTAVPYCNGIGMRQFLQRTVAGGPLDASRFIFFTSSPYVGIYDSATESWTEQEIQALNTPRQFQQVADGWVVLDDAGICKIDSHTLNAVRIVTLPHGALSASFQISGDTLQVAFIQDGSSVLWIEPIVGGDRREFRRDRSSAPDDFDPSSVIYASAHGSSITLIDRRGAIAQYDPSTGDWQRMRAPIAGQYVHGWIASDSPDALQLVLESEKSNTILVRLKDFRVTGENEIAGTFDNLPRRMRTLASTLENLVTLVPPARHLLLVAQDAAIHQAEIYDRCEVAGGDHILLNSPLFRINRNAGKANYEIASGNNWRILHTQQTGFADDEILGLCLSPQGTLWAFQTDRASDLKPADGHLLLGIHETDLPQKPTSIDILPGQELRINKATERVLLFREAGNGSLQKVDRPKDVLLGTLNLSQLAIDFTFANGSVDAYWRAQNGADVPISSPWSKDSNHLTIQCINDIAISNSTHELLLSTDAGLVVRDASSFKLKAIYPDILQSTFHPMHSADKIGIEVSHTMRHMWTGGMLKPWADDAQQFLDTVNDGPWDWKFLRSLDGNTHTLTVVDNVSGRTRNLVMTSDGAWQWKDDLAQWIMRPDNRGQMRVKSQDCDWMLNSQDGRVGGMIISGPGVIPLIPPETLAYQTPAIRISYSAGIVTFEPLDNKDSPVFIAGRFFFDCAAQFCADHGLLYSLVQDRCLVSRDPVNPALVTGMWRLPDHISAGTKCTLLPPMLGIQGMQLEARTPEIDVPQVWLFDRNNGWATPRKVEADTILATSGPIVWKRPTRGQQTIGIQPYWSDKVVDPTTVGAPAIDMQLPIADWWSNNRFCWDQVAAVGAVDFKTGVLVSDLGVEAVSIGQNNSSAMAAFWPIHGLTFAEPAVRDISGQVDGVALGTADEVNCRYRVSIDKAATPVMQLADRLPRRRPTVAVDYSKLGDTDQIVRPEERWETLAEGGSIGALESRLPQLKTEMLIRDGQFIFDRTQGAAARIGDLFGQWFTFCNAIDDSGLVCLNRIDDRKNLVLADVLYAPTNIDAMREMSGGDIFVISKPDAPSNPVVTVGQWDIQKDAYGDHKVLKWRAKDVDTDVTTAFQMGQKVTWDATGPDYSTAVCSRLDGTLPLTVSPAGYALFDNQPGGVALSFDVFTSMSFDRRSRTLSIGTRGGLFQHPWPVEPNVILKLGASPSIAVSSEAAPISQGIARVRRDRSGNLWVQLSREGTLACVTSSTIAPPSLVAWPPIQFERSVPHSPTLWPAIGVTSNNPWWFNRIPLVGCLDFAVDDSDRCIWICTSSYIFKVRTDVLSEAVRQQISISSETQR